MVKKYRVQEEATSLFAIRRIGACLLTFGAISLAVFHGPSEYRNEHAFAAATIPWILESVASIYNKEAENLGFSLTMNKLMLVVNAATLVGMVTHDKTFSPLLMRVYEVWWALHAVRLVVEPRWALLGMWKTHGFVSMDVLFLMRICGFPCLAIFTLLTGLDFGVNAAHLLGFANLALVAGLLAPLVLHEKGKRRLEERHQAMIAANVILTALIFRDS